MKQKQEKCDVVVLGSGIAGLGTAAILAKKGYKTVVAESLPIIGGRCSSLNYKGFKVPTGAVGIPLTGSINTMFDEAGTDLGADLTPMTVPPQYLVDNKLVDMPPEGPDGMLSLHCDDLAELGRLKRGFERTQTWNNPSHQMSLKEFLHQYTRNRNIIAQFNMMSDLYLTAGAAEVSAGEFFGGMTRTLQDFESGMGIAPQGSIAMMKSLQKTIEANDGKVLTQCRAKKILVQDGTAKGAVVEGKEGEMTISASAVVSNTGPQKTIALAGEEHFEAGYLRDVRNMIPSLQIWVTWVSDRPLYDGSYVLSLNTPNFLAFVAVSTICPEHELSPKGKHVLYSISRPPLQMRPVNYRDEVNLHIKQLKENFPNFDKYGEVLHAGCYGGGFPTYRNLPVVGYTDIPQKTPVENLYNVGDGAGQKGGWAGGAPGAAFTAKVVAEDIVNRFKSGQLSA